jgi:hypothetical protein
VLVLVLVQKEKRLLLPLSQFCRCQSVIESKAWGFSPTLFFLMGDSCSLSFILFPDIFFHGALQLRIWCCLRLDRIASHRGEVGAQLMMNSNPKGKKKLAQFFAGGDGYGEKRAPRGRDEQGAGCFCASKTKPKKNVFHDAAFGEERKRAASERFAFAMRFLVGFCFPFFLLLGHLLIVVRSIRSDPCVHLLAGIEAFWVAAFRAHADTKQWLVLIRIMLRCKLEFSRVHNA